MCGARRRRRRTITNFTIHCFVNCSHNCWRMRAPEDGEHRDGDGRRCARTRRRRMWISAESGGTLDCLAFGRVVNDSERNQKLSKSNTRLAPPPPLRGRSCVWQRFHGIYRFNDCTSAAGYIADEHASLDRTGMLPRGDFSARARNN